MTLATHCAKQGSIAAIVFCFTTLFIAGNYSLTLFKYSRSSIIQTPVCQLNHTCEFNKWNPLIYMSGCIYNIVYTVLKLLVLSLPCRLHYIYYRRLSAVHYYLWQYCMDSSTIPLIWNDPPQHVLWF